MLTQDLYDTSFSKEIIANCSVLIIVFDANGNYVGGIAGGNVFNFSMNRTNVGILETMPTDRASVEFRWDNTTQVVKNNLIKGRTVNVLFAVDGNFTNDAIILVIDNVKVNYEEKKATMSLISPLSLMSTTSTSSGTILYDNGSWVSGDLRTFPAYISQAESEQHSSIGFGYGRRFAPTPVMTHVAQPSLSLITFSNYSKMLIFDPKNIYLGSIKRYFDENDRKDIVAFGIDTSEETQIVEVETYYYMKNIKLEAQYAVTRVECDVLVNGNWVAGTGIIDSIFSNDVTVRCSSSSYSRYRFRLFGYKGNTNAQTTTEKILNCYCWLDTQTSKLEKAQATAREYYSQNTYFEFECRIDPRIEPQDIIHIKDIGMIRVEEVDLNFNGGFKGRIKGRIIMDDKQPPAILNLDNAYPNWSFTIKNNNSRDLTVNVSCSVGDFDILIPAFGSVTIDDGSEYADMLDASFYEASRDNLDQDVYCYWLEEPQLGNTIILDGYY